MYHVKLEMNDTNLATPVYKYTPCTHARERNKGEGGEQGMVERGEDIQYIHIRQSEHYLETILVSLRQFSKLNSICLR